MLRVRGSYSTFLEKKEEFLHAQSKRQEALENLVHNEIEWLRRGAKARTRKSKARIGKANELMGDLADLNARTRTATAQIDFSATDRKTKRLIELEDVTYQIGATRESTLFDKLNFVAHCRDAGRPGRAEWQRQNHAAAAVARRADRRAVARFAGPSGCASCTSTRPANSIPT